MMQMWIVCFPVNLLTNPVCEQLWFTLIFSNSATAVSGTLLYKRAPDYWSCFYHVRLLSVQCFTEFSVRCLRSRPKWYWCARITRLVQTHTHKHTHTLDVLNFLQPMIMMILLLKIWSMTVHVWIEHSGQITRYRSHSGVYFYFIFMG